MTPSGETGWSRTRNRDGTGSQRSPVVCGQRRDLSFSGRTCAEQASWACPGFEGDSDPAQASEVMQILPVLSGRDRQPGERQQEQHAHDGGDTLCRATCRRCQENRGRWDGRLALKCAGCCGRQPTGMSTATDLCGAGHGPVRHDHRPGDAADEGMWSGRRASNSRPQAWEAGALPTELRPHGAHCTMISVRLPSCTVA